jgi:hypothetical protein
MYTYSNASYITKTVNNITNNYLIKVTINGVESFVPIDQNNSDYINIMNLVATNQLIITSATI